MLFRSLVMVFIVVVADLLVFRTRVVLRRTFWVAYAIMLFFQLIINGLFTGPGIVRYNGDAILGESSPDTGAPPFVGSGRLAFAPIEDLLFGFALICLTVALWSYFGRLGVSREPRSGPPMWRSR
mgnify:CR=1 FL=1